MHRTLTFSLDSGSLRPLELMDVLGADWDFVVAFDALAQAA